MTSSSSARCNASRPISCRTRAEEFGRVWRVLDEAPSVEPSLGFDARLRQRIAVEPKPRWFEGFVPAPRLVFAMTVLLAIAVWISATQAPNQEIAQNPVQEEEFEMIENLQVLENYEVLKTLAELPPAPAAPKREM